MNPHRHESVTLHSFGCELYVLRPSGRTNLAKSYLHPISQNCAKTRESNCQDSERQPAIKPENISASYSHVAIRTATSPIWFKLTLSRLSVRKPQSTTLSVVATCLSVDTASVRGVRTEAI